MRWLLILMAGCWEAPAPAKPAVAPSSLEITETGFGPLDNKTVATLSNLRALLPQFHITPNNDPNLQFDIFDGKEQLAFIVTNDDGSIFNIHATSNKVRVASHTWRAGEPFQGAKDLTHCLCWGNNPVCFKRGDHVAVNFNRTCVADDPYALRALDGLLVQRVIWSPTGFGDDDEPPPPEDEEP